MKKLESNHQAIMACTCFNVVWPPKPNLAWLKLELATILL